MVCHHGGDGRFHFPSGPVGLTLAAALLTSTLPTAASANNECDSIHSCNVELLENFGRFQHDEAGLDILEQNLATEESIYASSTYDQKLLAAINSQLQGNVPYYNIWNLARPDLSYLFNQGSLLSPGTNFPTGSAYVTITGQALELTGKIAGEMKTHFAEDPDRASYSVYGVLPQYASTAAGDPRPFVVSEAINGNPWTWAQTSALAVTIQQSSYVPPGFQAQNWGEYVGSPAFPSGHSTAGNTLSILTGILAPQYYKDFLMAGIDFGLSRNIFGVHYPLDVIGGRLIATYNLAKWLNGADYDVGTADVDGASASLQAYIGSGGESPYAGACRENVVACIRAGAIPTADQFREARDLYTYYMTYGLPDFSDTGEAPKVPEGAEVLIATRFPYLKKEQLREVLATTELPSGSAFDNGTGWARLNLYAAADGFGALNCGGEGADGCTQTIEMDASAGGYKAFDVWANDMTGDGRLDLAGDGTLVLVGDSTYTGGTRVLGGTLAVTGSLFGTVDVASGAFFYNAGTIDTAAIDNEGTTLNDGLIDGSVLSSGNFGNNGRVSGDVESSGLFFGSGSIGGKLGITGGIIAPGNSVGTVEAEGDVELAAGTTYQAELARYEADRILTGGTASIEGALLDVDVAPGTILGLRQYGVLSAEGGVNGTFTLVDDPLTPYPFLDMRVNYEDDSVVVETFRSSLPFAALAVTPNQIATARSLDTAPLSGALSDAVLSLNPSTAPAGFAALSGAAGASAKSVLLNDSVFLRSAVVDRLRTADSPAMAPSGMAVAPLSYAAPAAPAAAFPVKAPSPAAPPSSALWAQAFGAWSSYDGNANARGLDSNTGGFLIGGDTLVENWRVGLLGGYSYTSFDSTADAAAGNSENWHIGAYAGRSWDALALRSGLAYSWHAMDLSRTVALPGFIGAGNADYDAGTFQAFGELAYGFDAGMVRLEPFGNLAYVQLHTDSYAETGSSAALLVDGSTMQTSFTTLGLRLAAPIPSGAKQATFNGMVGWRHAFGDVVPTQTQSFLIGGLPFTVSGVPLGEDVAVVEAGLEVAITPAAKLNVAYGGQFGDGFTQNGLSAALSVQF